MQTVKYNPFRELFATERDMYMEEGKLFIKTFLPHFKKEDISVTAVDDGLEIRAEREEKQIPKANKRKYIFKESSQNYIRWIGLPKGADKHNVICRFKDGELTISMPIAEQAEIKKIKVE